MYPMRQYPIDRLRRPFHDFLRDQSTGGILLFVVAMIGALIAGFGIGMHARRSVPHMVAYALVTAFSVWVILELEFPRRGLIRLDPTDRLLHEVRQGMDKRL